MIERNWVNDSISLQGRIVELRPLRKEHFTELIKLSKDKRIWEFYIFEGSNTEKFSSALELAITEKEKGNQFPYIIYHKSENKIIGSTRFLDLQPEHKKLEIGWTWMHPDYWGSEVNKECKSLLLILCFEYLNVVRVQLKTDENNIRSRKAIEKLGAKFECILRNDMIRDNGTKRNSALYSILDSEWNFVKENLRKKYI